MTKKTETAKTAQEVKEKYGRKRFNSSNAGKSLIYAFVYMGYQINERTPKDDVQPLYPDINAFARKVDTYEDVLRYNAYAHLEEWIRNGFKTAIFMRNSLNSVLSYFNYIAGTAISGEYIREEVTAKGAMDASLELWISTASIQCLRPQKEGYHTVLDLRKNIESGIRYLHAYNTFIELIAEEIEVPELTLYKVDTDIPKLRIDELNKALETLRECITGKHKVVPDGEPLRTLCPDFTQEELNLTLEAFSAVSSDPPPIPEKAILLTKRNMQLLLTQGIKTWTKLFSILSDDYWRPY